MKHTYTIMPIDTAHLDELCDDIERQCREGIAEMPLFKMTLVPEGKVPVNKAAAACTSYDLFREKLSSRGIPSGVLAQATIGHGWVLGEMFPYQRYVGLVDGVEQQVVCPYDEGFRTYIYQAMQEIAKHQPAHIMVDDDFRLMARQGGGCACPLHMKRFNELSGTSFTREELLEKLHETTKEAARYSAIFVETQKEALVDCARRMREGIDSVDPHLPGSFCCVGNNAEFAREIAPVLSGAGNPVVVRINNGNYAAGGSRYLSSAFFRAAAQVAKLKGKVDVILAETDTCPQNRYSTSASMLHAHFTGSILEGTMGAKHWITRLSSYERQSGEAYRRTLAKYHGFYQALSEVVPHLTQRGCRIPVLEEPLSRAGTNVNTGFDSYAGWGMFVLERLGLPMYFSSEDGGLLCLNGHVHLTDEQLQKALSKAVFLASDSAKELIDRGFGDDLGVSVRPWQGKTPTMERLYESGNKTKAQVKVQELVPCRDAEVDSVILNTVGDHEEELFPGTVVYQNGKGGMAVTFSGTPHAAYTLTEAFSFLNESRKRQLADLMRRAGELPVFYPGDEEVYLRAADVDDGSLFCAIFNIGLDKIDSPVLVFDRAITKIEQLLPDGTHQALSFDPCGEGHSYRLSTVCETLLPVVLFAR